MIKNLQFIRELPNPDTIKALMPVPSELKALKEQRDETVRNIFSGKDDRFVLIIGPCSADRQDAVLDYLHRLRKVQDQVADKIYIIPRIYTNKPRTTGEGYKGMLHQPDPEKPSDLYAGIASIRHLHLRAIRETGLTSADEMLYPENYVYLNDLLNYVAIGARSVEDQAHRLASSGLDIPVGMKNPTSGDNSVMLNAIMAAQHHHTFTYRGWEVHSSGNPCAHAILRGYVNKLGQTQPNYYYEDLLRLQEEYDKFQLTNHAVIVDCNHSNSGKKYLEQVRIANDVLHSCRMQPSLKKLVKGLMIESYLEDGCQKVEDGVYGKSITDPCLGWEKTEKLILELAEQL